MPRFEVQNKNQMLRTIENGELIKIKPAVS